MLSSVRPQASSDKGCGAVLMGKEKLSTDRGGLEDEDYLNAVDRC